MLHILINEKKNSTSCGLRPPSGVSILRAEFTKRGYLLWKIKTQQKEHRRKHRNEFLTQCITDKTVQFTENVRTVEASWWMQSGAQTKNAQNAGNR